MTVYFKSSLTKTTTDPKKIFSELTKQVVEQVLPHAGICFSFPGVIVDSPQTFLPGYIN